MKSPAILAALIFAGLLASCRPGVLMQRRDVWDATCDLQVVSLPEDLALPLIDKLRDPHSSEGAFKDLQKLIAEKRATLVGWPVVTTQSGHRAVAEQVDELRYGTEFEPPGKTITTETPVASTASPPSGPAADSNTAHPDVTKTTINEYGGPTAFETRNLGVTFEVSPTVAPDGEMIEVDMAPQHVRLLEWTDTAFVRDPPSMKVSVLQPRFSTNKVAATITFHNGERKLVGLFKALVPAGNVELFIVRVDAQKRKVMSEGMTTLPAPSSSASGSSPPASTPSTPSTPPPATPSPGP